MSLGPCPSTLGGGELFALVRLVLKPLQSSGEQLVEEFVLGQLRSAAPSHEQHRVAEVVGERLIYLQRAPSSWLPLLCWGTVGS